ncbi:MAG TPA: hypothetical protein VMH04_21300 [Candidatus Solibacter sp.]|nr:hypothetical protein [Candidatus Solibacter sp.]
MKNRILLLLLGLFVAFSLVAHAQKDDDDDDDQLKIPHPPVMKPTDKPSAATFSCPYEQNFQQAHKVGAYTLRLMPVKQDKDDKDDKDQDADPRCRAVLTAANGKKITIAYEWALNVDPVSGSDFNGDGTPDLVLSGYSGGLHCCYVYEIVSLGKTPQELHTFQNPVPITFEKQSDGTVLIRASDGVFDYFIIPHADAFIPQLVLKLDGNNLVDVSAKYPEVYDREIDQARSQLTPEELEKFKKSNFHDKLYTDQIPTVRKVLTIVLDYVYSGREDKAWQALEEMWPDGDASRVKSLISERRNRGMLSNLACDCRPAMIAKPGHNKRKPSPPDEISDPRIKSIIDD